MKHDPIKAEFDTIFESLLVLGFKRKRANKIITKLVNEFFDEQVDDNDCV